MLILRLYLFAGLVIHKVVWETLKRSRQRDATRSGIAALAKAVKTAILIGIVVQTWLPDVLPISTEPTPVRAAGVLIYTVGLAVAILGRVQLGGNWSDIEEAGLVSGQTLVTRGIYAYIRHPIYIGDLLLLLGLELALNSWLAAGVLMLAPVVLNQAVREERMLRRTLPGYDAYCERTKRFIPFAL
ncbi:MAG: isoprenylcysteine carboxylmethyltransferase family protein [Gemmatimonadetes bacterium]|nr:isoprenylcysteine carboxylmethyltransferase family protein [Gemmatimonadota bacterium]